MARQYGYSPFHFHRFFSNAVGETPKQHVDRLRLERAAYKLAITGETVLEIALSVGFKNHETFSRAFKRAFGYSPRDYRRACRTAQAERLERNREFRGEGCLLSDVRFVSLPAMTLLAIRRHGAYADCPVPFRTGDDFWNDLVDWAKRNKVSYRPLAFAISYDDPTLTPKALQRLDACIPIGGDVAAEGRIRRLDFAGGRYGGIEHAGPLSTIDQAYRNLADGIRRSRQYVFDEGPPVADLPEDPYRRRSRPPTHGGLFSGAVGGLSAHALATNARIVKNPVFSSDYDSRGHNRGHYETDRLCQGRGRRDWSIGSQCPHCHPRDRGLQHLYRTRPSARVLRRGRPADRAVVLAHRRHGTLLRRGLSVRQATPRRNGLVFAVVFTVLYAIIDSAIVAFATFYQIEFWLSMLAKLVAATCRRLPRNSKGNPMTAAEIVKQLQRLGSDSYRKILLNHCIKEPVFGVKVEELKKFQKRIKKDYQLALDLYDTGIYDAMYLAGLIADDAKMTKKDLTAGLKKPTAACDRSRCPGSRPKAALAASWRWNGSNRRKKHVPSPAGRRSAAWWRSRTTPSSTWRDSSDF